MGERPIQSVRRQPFAAISIRRYSVLDTMKAAAVVLLMTLAGAATTPGAASEARGALTGRTIGFDEKIVKKVTVVLTSPDDPSFSAETTSDKNGRFNLEVDNADLSYQVTLSKRGYVGMTLGVDIKAGPPTVRDFTVLTERELAEGKGDIVRERELARVDPAVEIFNEGAAAFAEGEMDTARERFEAALEEDGRMVPALSALSFIAMQEKNWPLAADWAARTLAIDPTDTKALFAAYRAATALGNDDEAAAATAVLKAEGTNVDLALEIFTEGVQAYRAPNYKKAEGLFLQVVELDPTLAEARLALAGVYGNMGKLEEAAAEAEAMLALVPDDPRALRVRLEAYLATGDDRLGAAAADLAAVDPALAATEINEKAFDLFEADRTDDARKLAELSLDLDPGDPRANYLLGLIMVNSGEIPAARLHLEKFVAVAPEDPDADAARSLLLELQDSNR
jgi:tetratricopeptide (TPR) repeat protein